MTANINPNHCQPNRSLLFHLNNHSHTLTPNIHDYQPTHYSITLNMNLKNPHIISTYHVSNKDSTTTLIHTILHPVRSTKRKRHSRMTITQFQPTTQLPVTRSLLHQQTYLIMTTILFLPPTRATYHFIVYTLHNSLQSSSNAF